MFHAPAHARTKCADHCTCSACAASRRAHTDRGHDRDATPMGNQALLRARHRAAGPSAGATARLTTATKMAMTNFPLIPSSRPFGASLLMPEERPPPKRQFAADRQSIGLPRLLNHGSVIKPFPLFRTDALPPHRKC